jgi:DMSO/TMAO reductase YedYZ molybdopterin-dependent catalytic subunit
MNPHAVGAPVGRRVVLGMLGLGALGVVAGSRAQSGLERVLAPVQNRDPSGLSNLLPGSGFRYYSVASSVPVRTAASYRLAINGLVDHPTSLTIDELRALPPTRLVRDFQCVTGWRVPAVPWVGVRLSALLAQVGVRNGATAVRLRSYDGVYTESLTLDQARRDDVIVAYEMLGEPVTRDHGGPVRLYAAPMYGYKSVKWLGAIEVTRAVIPGYWELRGYDVDAWVGQSNGRDDAATS